MELVGVYGFRQAYAGMAVNAEMIGKAKYGMSGRKEANVRGADCASKASPAISQSREMKRQAIQGISKVDSCLQSVRFAHSKRIAPHVLIRTRLQALKNK